MLRMILSNAYLARGQRVELHCLQKAPVHSIDQVDFLMILHVRVHAKRSADLMLHKFPPEHLQTDHRLRQVLLQRLIKVAADRRIAIGFGNGLWLAFLGLGCADSLAEAISHVNHVVRLVEKLEVRPQVFKNVCLVIEVIDVLKQESVEV